MQTVRDAGFTLIEVLVVAALAVMLAAGAGTLFLGGATPAVAVAARDVAAVFDEARQTARADDAATVVFAAEPGAGGYTARVYRRFPGDPGFGPQNGPGYAGRVAISETAAPLGVPGFAFRVDAFGTVTGYADYSAGDATVNARACPSGGAYQLRLAAATDVRVVAVPCALAPSSAGPVAFATAAPAVTPPPALPATCPAGRTCVPAAPVGGTAACPPGYTPDAGTAGLCDLAVASPAPSAAPSTIVRAPVYVCSALPYGTDLGPAPDGGEDYSNGMPCSTTLSSAASTVPMKFACGPIPHAAEWTCDGTASAPATFTASGDSVVVTFANRAAATNARGVFGYTATAAVVLAGPSATRYCLASAGGSGIAEAQMTGLALRLPEGPGTYTVAFGASAQGAFDTDAASSSSGTLTWSETIGSAPSGSGTFVPAAGC